MKVRQSSIWLRTNISRMWCSGSKCTFDSGPFRNSLQARCEAGHYYRPLHALACASPGGHRHRRRRRVRQSQPSLSSACLTLRNATPRCGTSTVHFTHTRTSQYVRHSVPPLEELTRNINNNMHTVRTFTISVNSLHFTVLLWVYIHGLLSKFRFGLKGKIDATLLVDSVIFLVMYSTIPAFSQLLIS